MTGRTHELKVDKTTIGRVEDNIFQIAEPSVSSHHCEILLQGNEVVVRDLNSTNGTFINGEKITEKVLKPGQILRLGQIEMRLETDYARGGAGSEEACRSDAGDAARREPDRTGTGRAAVTGFDTKARVLEERRQGQQDLLDRGGRRRFADPRVCSLYVFMIAGK